MFYCFVIVFDDVLEFWFSFSEDLWEKELRVKVFLKDVFVWIIENVLDKYLD